ncbi:MAG: DUF4251 domain-containing protein [Alistipes sp.]|nr:DUF4251 domain-containing protein [Alistipes sp.]
MKTPCIFILSLVIFAACSTSNHYSSLSKQEVETLIGEGIAGRDMVIDVNRALPMQGRSVTLTGSYNLRIKGDTVFSSLPYYGRAYSLPYGGGEGMMFEGKVEDYKVASGSKGETDVSFRVRTTEDVYQINIGVWPNGSADIRVNPQNKQMITYMGTVRLGPGK